MSALAKRPKVKYYLRMDRRESTLNLFLGLSLLLIYAVLVAGAVGAVALLIRAVQIAVVHFFPAALLHDKAIFFGFAGVSLLIAASKDVARRNWRRSFLTFAIVLSCGLVYASSMRTGHNSDLPLIVLVGLFALCSNPYNSDQEIDRTRFILGACFISAMSLLDTGILGLGDVVRLGNDLLYLGFILWFAIWGQKDWEKKDTGSQTISQTAP